MFVVKKTTPKAGIAPGLFADVSDPSPPRKYVEDWQTQDQLEENQVLKNFGAKARRKKVAEYIEQSTAKGPSRKQVGYLAMLLGHPGREAMSAFVRYANAYLPYTQRLTSLHFVEAINLALHGRNSWGSETVLQELSELDGPLWTGEGETGARHSFAGRKRKAP